MFGVDRDAVLSVIRQRGATTVLMLFPEGVLHEGPALAEWLGRQGVSALVWGDPHWGGCDVPQHLADSYHLDLVLSFGHTQYMVGGDERVVYVPMLLRVAPTDAGLVQALTPIVESGVRSVSLAWSTEYEDVGRRVHAWLLERVDVRVAGAGPRVSPGQVLGCDYSGLSALAGGVDAHLIVADAFHATGGLLAVDGVMLWLDPSSVELRDITPLRQELIEARLLDVAAACGARRFGVLVERRLGQVRLEPARRLKALLEEWGAQASILIVHDITPEKLARFVPAIEVFVNTACQRVESFPERGVRILGIREILAVVGRIPAERLYPEHRADSPVGCAKEGV